MAKEEPIVVVKNDGALKIGMYGGVKLKSED